MTEYNINEEVVKGMFDYLLERLRKMEKDDWISFDYQSGYERCLVDAKDYIATYKDKQNIKNLMSFIEEHKDD